MATRKIYTDEKGNYFKGEKLKFRHSVLAKAKAGDKVTDVTVSCGQGGAMATFVFQGKRYSSSAIYTHLV